MYNAHRGFGVCDPGVMVQFLFFAHVGGNVNNGANAGLFYWNLNNASSNSNWNIGARLLILILLHITFLVA